MADAALAATERELAAARAAAAQHAERLAAAQQASAEHGAALGEAHAREQSRIRALELHIAELPAAEDLQALEAACAARLADSCARVVELEAQLSRAADTVVSERVEQLLAVTRALEIQLSEAADAEEVAQLRARVTELEVASAAAAARARDTPQRSEPERPDAARTAPSAQPLHAAPPAAPHAAPTAQTAVSQARAVVHPDGIELQLRRIEELLVSLPTPTLRGAPPVRGRAGCAGATPATP